MAGDDHLISFLSLIHQLALAGSRLSSSSPRGGDGGNKVLNGAAPHKT